MFGFQVLSISNFGPKNTFISLYWHFQKLLYLRFAKDQRYQRNYNNYRAGKVDILASRVLSEAEKSKFLKEAVRKKYTCVMRMDPLNVH